MEYRAVTKDDPKKDLIHWKYIKREKVNGKWRYTYNKENVDKAIILCIENNHQKLRKENKKISPKSIEVLNPS